MADIQLKSKRKMPRIPKILLVILAGLALGALLSVLLGRSTLGAKLRGDAPDCPWARVLAQASEQAAFHEIQRGLEPLVSVKQRDDKLAIELVQSPGRAFWIGRGEAHYWGGKQLLTFLFAEHTWKARMNPGQTVRAGDVVFDCGAHVGVFTHMSLERGASKVVAIEPDPLNQDCLRRNLAPEIATGKVVLVPKGVWSSAQTLVLSESTLNSGNNSFVMGGGGQKIEIPVTTIDTLVSELGLPRVDYIKIDIEGSEREALKGARETVRKYRPRMMIDTYHRPDDLQVLPAVIREARADYTATCGPCEFQGDRLVPHTTFFH